MSNPAPGVYVSVSASSPSAAANPSTGTWFVTGETAQGPVGVAVPITSVTDYTSFLGPRVSYGFLYDALTEYFHDGGVQAYVSRVAGPTGVAAHVSIVDRVTPTPNPTLVATAVGPGAWGNHLKVTVAAGSVSTTYTLKVTNNTVQTVPISPNLFTPADALAWATTYEPWQIQVAFTNSGDVSVAPTNLPKVGVYDLASGATQSTTIVEATWTNALTAFIDSLGPGQVSAPGHTTTDGYEALVTHASLNNRVAILDVADNASATSLVTQAQDIQALSGLATTFSALCAPWLVIPGIFNTNPGTSPPIPTRTIPPSALFAAKMALNDQSSTNTCNTPSAGANGQSTYVLNVTHTYSTAALALLNNSGVCVVKPVYPGGVVTIYGYVTLSRDPNWAFLNNVRFRMQLVNDLDVIGEGFVFQQITGKGHLFARFNGAISGKLQEYYTRNALYGATATAAYSVNTSPQVNTPTTISNNEVRALVGVIMSPFAEFVYLTITKYLLSQGLPA